MDVIKEKKPSLMANKRKLVVASTLVLVAVIGLGSLVAKASKAPEVTVARETIRLGTVRQGNMSVKVDGYGVLRSNQQKLLSAQNNATVEEIILKPGSDVTEGSVILKLENPELEQLAFTEKQRLLQEQSVLKQLKLTHQRNLMEEEDKVTETKSSYELVKLRLNAIKKLTEDGIVSSLEYQELELREKQMSKRVINLQARLLSLRAVQQEELRIQQEKINQQENQYDLAQRRLNELTVIAGMSGVVQGLYVEIGQSLVAGQKLAQVGSVTDLVALVKVPQSKAQLIALGQRAIINTRADLIEGKVSRINSAVENGSVTVEVVLTEDLPDSARPELSVDAEIFTHQLDNIAYVEMPINTRSNSISTVFKLSPHQNDALATQIEFGADDGRVIQILSGAQQGDILVLSDLSNLNNFTRIGISK